MGVILHDKWEKWLPGFDKDDPRWKDIWSSEVVTSERVRTAIKRVEETRNMCQTGLTAHEKDLNELKESHGMTTISSRDKLLS